VAKRTPLQRNENLSLQYECNVWLKREDHQNVRSYKIRGAYNKIHSLSSADRAKGVICASAGNHAQGFAYACKQLEIKGRIYMPSTTTAQKIKQVKMFGEHFVKIILEGDTFDDSYTAAKKECDEQGLTFVHPFDDPKIIEGQGTVGLEIYEDSTESFDYLFLPIGGGGLSAGVGSYFKQLSPQTEIIGVEPKGAPAMKKSIEAGHVVCLDDIDKFVDGAAVKQVGHLTFDICKEILSDIVLVPEGKICTTILQLYNENAIVVEPAGALSVAALDFY
ncbi:UNVERIFIED_CONTAM: hypothetical protein GTU68_060853, partial [Idotea baltica]|nr:hypothetical protein [Idotea baltica]